MSKSHYEMLSHKFKKARLDHRWSQKELADQAGVAQLSIFRLEHSQNVSIKFLEKVANALGCKMEYNLEDKHNA